MLKLQHENTDEPMWFKDMKVGDIGIIKNDEKYGGVLVLKTKRDVVQLDGTDRWSNDYCTLEVDILPKGTTLVVG